MPRTVFYSTVCYMDVRQWYLFSNLGMLWLGYNTLIQVRNVAFFLKAFFFFFLHCLVPAQLILFWYLVWASLGNLPLHYYHYYFIIIFFSFIFHVERVPFLLYCIDPIAVNLEQGSTAQKGRSNWHQ